MNIFQEIRMNNATKAIICLAISLILFAAAWPLGPNHCLIAAGLDWFGTCFLVAPIYYFLKWRNKRSTT